MIRLLILFLFQTLIGTVLLAFVGFLTIACAVFGTAMELSHEREAVPTPLALTDFEKDGKIPAQRWIEFTDGVLLWNEATEVVAIRKDKNGKQIGKETVKVVFVPLVSKKVVDAAKGFQDDLKQPLHNARVLVRFKPNDFANQVLKEEGNPDVRPRLNGMVSTLDKEEKLFVDALAPKGSLKDPTKMLVVQYNQSVPTTGVVICVGVFFAMVGLVFMLPFAVWLLSSMTRPRAASPYRET